MSLLGSLETGKSALLTRQAQMSVIGNNIANAGTVGYHRQAAILVENAPFNNKHFQTGTGTHVQQIVRAFDKALEGNLRTAVEQNAYYSELSKYMQVTEEVLAIDGVSVMTEALNSFSNSLQDLANNSESDIHRSAFLANAELVSSSFNNEYKLLTDIRDRIASSGTQGVIPDDVAAINTLATELATINQQIVVTEAQYRNGQQAIEFRDQRDAIVSEMAKLADITILEQSDGSYDLSIGGTTMIDSSVGGVSSVIDTLAFSFAAGPPPAPSVNWTVAGAATLTSGSIKGLLDSHQFVQDRVAELETYMTTFASEVNSLHAVGFDRTGTLGTDIFDATTPGAMTILITNPDLVAAGDNALNIGDGDNARAMWSGLNANLAAINNDTLMNHADHIIDFVAVERQKTESLERSTDSSIELFTQIINEKSGVSIDEEMVSMLETQRAFQGAAKFVRAVDELLQTVINLV